jgi:hypothetical protein
MGVLAPYDSFVAVRRRRSYGPYPWPVVPVHPPVISVLRMLFCAAGPADATLVLHAPVSHALRRGRWMCQFVWTELAATAVGATRRTPESAYGYTYGAAASRTRQVSTVLNPVRAVATAALRLPDLRAVSRYLRAS